MGTTIDRRPTKAAETQQISCVQEHEDNCEGEVQYRMALSGTGTSFARCDHHWGERLDEQERINRRYPDTDMPPAWFDPFDAGERWNYDD